MTPPKTIRSLPRLACAACLLGGGLFGGCQSLDPARRGESKPKPMMGPGTTGRAPAVSVGGSSEVNRAQMYVSQGDYQKALEEFEKAIASNPRLTVAYMGAGDIYRQQGDYPNAEKRYATAADLEPANFSAQYLYGLVLQLQQKIGEAVRVYLKALAIRPEDFNANLNLGTAYLQLNEPSQGLAYAERAVRLEPKSAAARANLGAIYSALNRNEDAITEYQQAAELTPLTGPLLLNLADAYLKAEHYEEAANTLEQLLKSESSAAAQERLGTALFRLRRYEDSLAHFRAALDIDPNYFPALNGAAVCLLNQWYFSEMKDAPARQEAVSMLRRSLQIERNQPQILDLLSKYQR